MKQTSIMIKPASSECNMKCTYCFYDDVSDCRTTKSYGLMSFETASKIATDAINSEENYNHINFIFQGGEPLVVGIKFYEKLLEYIESIKGNVNITYSIQTNGTKINKAYCELFKKFNFLVGVSLDGYESNHNLNRFLYGAGSYESVMTGIRLLEKYNIEYNIVSVLTKKLAKNPKKLFDFYLENDFRYVQLIPCLPSFDLTAEEDLFACTPEMYGSFYVSFFECWLEALKKGNYLSDNLIDNIVRLFLGEYPQRCGMLGKCNSQCIVEADGGIYPCDFYVVDEYQMGSIKNQPLDDIMKSEVSSMFVTDNPRLGPICSDCSFASVCNGGCKRMRVSFVNDSICGYKELLGKVSSNMPIILDSLSRL